MAFHPPPPRRGHRGLPCPAFPLAPRHRRAPPVGWAPAPSLPSLCLGPLGPAGPRRGTPARGAGGQASLDERLAAMNKEDAFYAILRAKRWPMTKLMADIACAAPIGVTAENI